jgi:branched-chain amino acid aminotransferase
MNSYINFNGSLVRSDKPVVTADNRGLHYGDGFFETIKIVNSEIMLADFHFERLLAAIKLLQFDLPVFFTEEQLSVQILELCKKNNHPQSARVRMMVFRGDGGLYDPKNHFPNYIIQSWALADGKNQLNENGLVTSVFPDGRKACDSFSSLKSNNFLLYAMAALYAKKNQVNDCMILNTHDRICETTIANIFCIKDKIIYTPPLSEGCVAGVMRRYLLKALPGTGYTVIEKQLGLKDMQEADEVFLSNAIRGIRWVQRFEDVEYRNEQTASIYDAVIKNLS